MVSQLEFRKVLVEQQILKLCFDSKNIIGSEKRFKESFAWFCYNMVQDCIMEDQDLQNVFELVNYLFTETMEDGFQIGLIQFLVYILYKIENIKHLRPDFIEKLNTAKIIKLVESKNIQLKFKCLQLIEHLSSESDSFANKLINHGIINQLYENTNSNQIQVRKSVMFSLSNLVSSEGTEIAKSIIIHPIFMKVV